MNNDLELEVIRIPLCGDDVPALERLLSMADPFVATTIDTPNPYCLADYVQNSMYGDYEVHALLDRNLVSRAVALASGEVVDHGRMDSDTYRLAAACMSFLITAQVTIEPNIAFYEFASHDPGSASGQTKSWRVADHVHPQAYLDVALGRANTIDLVARREAQRLVADQPPESPPLGTRLRYFRHHHCTLSQVALLDRSDLSSVEKMRQLIDWFVNSTFFNGLAISFAIVFFGRHRAGRMLKGVRSSSGKRCLAGIRNAAWDLTYLSSWVKSARDQSCIWIFCTGDQILARVARAAVGGGEESAQELFWENWPSDDAAALYAHYMDAWKKVQNSSDREAEFHARYQRLDAITAEIEKKILQGCQSA